MYEELFVNCQELKIVFAWDFKKSIKILNSLREFYITEFVERNDRGSMLWPCERIEREELLNFVSSVANNSFVGETTISTADASQLAIFDSLLTRQFMPSALYLSFSFFLLPSIHFHPL